jgi:hypothetical protein
VDYWRRWVLWCWIKRRHKGKHLRQHLAKYFASKRWVFSSRAAHGPLIELQRLSALGIKRPTKIRGEANSYDPKDAEYFR